MDKNNNLDPSTSLSPSTPSVAAVSAVPAVPATDVDLLSTSTLTASMNGNADKGSGLEPGPEPGLEPDSNNSTEINHDHHNNSHYGPKNVVVENMDIDNGNDDGDDDGDVSMKNNSLSSPKNLTTIEGEEKAVVLLPEREGGGGDKSISMNTNQSNDTAFFTASSTLEGTATTATATLKNNDDTSNNLETINKDMNHQLNSLEENNEQKSSDSKMEMNNDSNINNYKNENNNDNDNKNSVQKSIQRLPEQTKSWHLEMLFGLFLQCDNDEMKDIANQSKLRYSTLNTTTTATTINTASCNQESEESFNHHLPRKTKTSSTTKYNRKRKRPRFVVQKQNEPRVGPLLSSNKDQCFFVQEQDEEENEPNVFPIFTEVLRRFQSNHSKSILFNSKSNSNKNKNTKNRNSINTTDNTSTTTTTTMKNYTRKSYTQRSIKQLEKAVMNQFQQQIVTPNTFTYSINGQEFTSPTSQYNNVKIFNSGNDYGGKNNHNRNNDQMAKRKKMDKQELVGDGGGGSSYRPISLLYNECSVKALSNWAIPPFQCRLNHRDVSLNYNNGIPGQRIGGRNYNLKRTSYVPIASTTFRRCTVCYKFGHYEVECEKLSQKQVPQCVEISKRLYDEMKTQNVLRRFSSPYDLSTITRKRKRKQAKMFGRKGGIEDYSSDSSQSHDWTKEAWEASTSSTSTDEEAYTLVEVKQDMELVQSNKNRMIHSSKFDCVMSDTENQNKKPKTDLLTSLMNMSDGRNASPSFTRSLQEEESYRKAAELAIKEEKSRNRSEKIPSYEVCEVCRSKYQADELLVCDGCDRLYHKQCLDPPLEDIPEGDWFCPNCYSYDSDVSSTVEIEGIEDFVIEQRKLTKEEKSMSKNGYFPESDLNNWNAHVTIIPPESSLMKDMDELPAQETLVEDDNEEESEQSNPNGNNDEDEIELSVGELCFAKRSAPMASLKAVYSRDMFWPAMVVKVHDSNIGFDGSIQTKYIVKIFALSGSGRVRASHVVPFFPNYVKLGHDKLKYRDEDWSDNFRRGMMEALSQLGITSLAQALTHAREITNPAPLPKPIEKPVKRTMKLSKEVPTNAELTQIDNFAIVSLPEKTDSSQATNDVKQNFPEETEEEEEDQVYDTDKLIGGVVSFMLEDDQKELNYGVLLGVDTTRRKVLVHLISDLSRVIRSNHKETLENESIQRRNGNLCNVYSCKLGASLWLPIESIIHCSVGAKPQETQYCSYLINEAISDIQKRMRADNELEHKIREDRMMKMDSMAHLGFEKVLYNFDQSSYSESRSKSTSFISTSIEDIDSSSFISTQSEEIVQSPIQNTETNTASLKEEKSLIKKVNTRHDTKTKSPKAILMTPKQSKKVPEKSVEESKAPKSEKLSPSKCTNGGTIFTVDQILDDRINRQGVKEFLIKWKGFDDDENTWEIQKNILDTNVLRKYEAEKLLHQLVEKPEASDKGSDTCRVIEVIEEGIHLLNTMLTITTPKPRKNRCPFCFQDFNVSGLGPHIKLHSEQPNFELIKQVTKIADIDWYKAWEGSKGRFVV